MTSSTTMTAEVAQQLCAPFPAEFIGKLPRVTCSACSKGQCQEHKKQRCDVCSSYISERHMHLDYVGHADVTNRLITVDPEWSWEPMATDEHGLPLCDTTEDGNPVGLWIRLTVAGVTRLGYGSCPANQNDAVKVLIGDALRNAAMRFGVATDLWAKGDRSDPSTENATGSGGQASRRAPRKSAQSDPLVEAKREAAQLHASKGYGSQPEQIKETFVRLTGMDVEALQTVAGCQAFVEALRKDVGATPQEQGSTAA